MGHLQNLLAKLHLKIRNFYRFRVYIKTNVGA